MHVCVCVCGVCVCVCVCVCVVCVCVCVCVWCVCVCDPLCENPAKVEFLCVIYCFLHKTILHKIKDIL